MPELPEYMLQKERQVDSVFLSDEHLYRRVRPEDWENEDINVDAIAFPDMSVTREKYGPPQSARWDRNNYVDWGIIGFQVKNIPAEIPYQGAFIYMLRAVHRPLRKNYPHSEVQVFEVKWLERKEKSHISKENIGSVPKEAQQVWRELLRRQCRIILRPGEEGEVT